MHFFATAEAAEPWLADHPAVTILPVADAQRQGRDLIEALPGADISCTTDCC